LESRSTAIDFHIAAHNAVGENIRVLSDTSIALGANLDPALLAFIKCHVTSALKWEALRLLGTRQDTWVSADDIAHVTQRSRADVEAAVGDLVRQGVVEQAPANATSYRLSASEPTSVVLHRLIDSATHSFELRSIIAAWLGSASRSQESGLRARTVDHLYH
jgi:biotin operon repressor